MSYTALYPRVSTGLQVKEGTSLEGQTELCLAKAKELGISDDQIKIYKEEGYSGEDIERPAMDRLREDVSKGLISTIIVVHPDRLSRNLIDRLLVCQEWKKKGAELIFVDTEYKDTPEGHLFFNMQSAISEYELALIRKRTIRGKLKACSKGQIMPMRVPPYGYDYEDGKLLINEEEAKVVKMIYKWYIVDGLTYREMIKKLHEQGIQPKRREAEYWFPSSIRRILSSETYTGVFYYNKRKTKKVKGQRTKWGNQKYTYEIRDKEDWIEIEVPAIIDEGTFQLAQERKVKNKKKGGNVKYQYLLKSMMKCGYCGRVYQSTSYSSKLDKETGKKTYKEIYRCGGTLRRKMSEDKCISKGIRGELLDNYVWNMVVDSLKNPDSIIENRIKKETNDNYNELDNMLKMYQKQFAQKQKERDKVKMMFRKEYISEEEMEEDMTKMNKDIKRINSEIFKIQEKIGNQKNKEMAAKSLTGLFDAYKELENEMDNFTFDQKKHLIDLLIDEIIVKDEGEIINITCIGTLDLFNVNRSLNKEDVSCSQLQKV